jgi:1-deoxy-D-xylulose-5-phosphate synthase
LQELVGGCTDHATVKETALAGLLDSVKQPRDLDRLSRVELDKLAAEIREFLIENVSRTGGHLGPNLGVVELTIGLHRVFDSPRDALIWDVGHQAYVHKLLTGRQDFEKLRCAGGLSGYPSRSESEHDIVENSHASTALSYADGVAKAFRLQGLTDRRVVGVIGDGALTGGMAWEALNNIAGGDLPVVIVVNDNERSYAPTIGGLSNHLGTLRTTQGYERFLDWGKNTLARTPYVGGAIYETLHGMKKGLKDIVAPQGMFEDLGLKYIGPIDGHDVDAVESALRRAKAFGGPVIVHVLTRKGEGYEPARADVVRPASTRSTRRPTRRPDCRSRSRAPRGPTCSPRRCSRSATTARRGGHHRRDAPSRSACTSSPSSTRSASTTWASPSSTPPPARRAWPSAGCTRSSRSTRPS